jgi:hypothetical protein
MLIPQIDWRSLSPLMLPAELFKLPPPSPPMIITPSPPRPPQLEESARLPLPLLLLPATPPLSGMMIP